MSNLDHEMIFASAGSGKTFVLTNRFIALMGVQLKTKNKVEPHKIIALTFTRKAAGEFFDAILSKLSKASSDSNFFKTIIVDKEDPVSKIILSLSKEDYKILLRSFIDSMPRIFLGTLDSFFVNILKFFPDKFNLPSDFELVSDSKLRDIVNDLYKEILRPNINLKGASKKDDKLLIKYFQKVYDSSGKLNVIESFSNFISSLQELYLKSPNSYKWGCINYIWGKDSFYNKNLNIDLDDEFGKVVKYLNEKYDKESSGKWEDFRKSLKNHLPGNRPDSVILTMTGKFFPIMDKLSIQTNEIKILRKTYKFDPVVGESISLILKYFLKKEIDLKVSKTQQVWKLINLFESYYNTEVRKKGYLSFADIPLILNLKESIFGKDTSNITLGQFNSNDVKNINSSNNFLNIEYRLDSRYDHWLLDEFQDTSSLQWNIIENLIDEIIQDQTKERSFFLVGDIKQSIYDWRGGNPELFFKIKNHYNANKECIKIRNLDLSYRSVLDILSPVNKIFGNKDVLNSVFPYPEITLSKWKWEDHYPSDNLKNKSGYTAWLVPSKPGSEDEEGSELVLDLICELLKKINPIKRGLSCGILTSKNKFSNDIINYVRNNSDISIVGSTKKSIIDEAPINLSFISFFKLALNPKDSFSWEHIKMTPYVKYIESNNLDAFDLSNEISNKIFNNNFEFTGRYLVDLLKEINNENRGNVLFDELTLELIDEFIKACRIFDETNSFDIGKFIEHIKNYTFDDSSSSKSVQAITYHKSKGLTFDFIILADFDKNEDFQNISERHLNFEFDADSNDEINWVLDMPRKYIIEGDKTLKSALKNKICRRAYESLCKYYVGMTRAKFANYIICKNGCRETKKSNFISILNKTLSDNIKGEDELEIINFCSLEAKIIYESNTPNTKREWYKDFNFLDNKKPDESQYKRYNEEYIQKIRNTSLPKLLTPSKLKNNYVSIKNRLKESNSSGLLFGKLVHEMYEEILWYDPFYTIDKLLNKWRFNKKYDLKTINLALDQIKDNMENKDIFSFFKSPENNLNVKLWVEKKFEIIINDKWISGVFDRVIIKYDDAGNVLEANIIDFKTDKKGGGIQREDIEKFLKDKSNSYKPQLLIYRESLSKLLNISESKIKLNLIFTQHSRVLNLF